MSEIGLKAMGRDPLGNARSVSVDGQGNLINKGSMIETVMEERFSSQGREILAGQSWESEVIDVSFASKISIYTTVSAPRYAEVEIYWLNSEGNDLAGNPKETLKQDSEGRLINENLVVSNILSPKCKIVIKNTDTETLQIGLSVYLSPHAEVGLERNDDGSKEELLEIKKILQETIKEKSYKEVFQTKQATLEDTEEAIVYETTKPIKISFLEFSTNNSNGRIMLHYRNKATENFNPIGQINLSGTSGVGMRASEIVFNNSSMWKVLSYEEGKYKFALNKEWSFPSGTKITISNHGSPEPLDIICRFFGVEEE